VRGFRITYNAPVILTFSLLAALVQLIGGDGVSSGFKLYFVAWPHLHELPQYLGLFTHILGHGNWAHLVGNFSMILLLGPILEERHGSGSLLIMIGLTALVTGLIHAVFFKGLLLGASGIVFMFILLASMVNIRRREIPLTFILVAILYLGAQVHDAFAATTSRTWRTWSAGLPERRSGSSTPTCSTVAQPGERASALAASPKPIPRRSKSSWSPPSWPSSAPSRTSSAAAERWHDRLVCWRDLLELERRDGSPARVV